MADLQRATFGAGCFTRAEVAFRKLKGVVSTRIGYMGGTVERPTHREVCTGRTGHAQVVEVTFDPSVISYRRLLQAFWNMHDPTSLNRQGRFIGPQYRSVIFYHSEKQRREAEESKDDREHYAGRYRSKIVTQIVPAATFWPAEVDPRLEIEDCSCDERPSG